MKILTAGLLLTFAFSLCNLSQRLANRSNHNRAPVKTVQPPAAGYGTPFSGNIDQLFPKSVLDYKLVFTIDPRKFGQAVPEGTEVRGGVYRSKKNEIVKHMLVNFGTIEEAARNLQIFLRKARQDNPTISTEPVRGAGGTQIGERFSFTDSEENLLWTNGSIFSLVKTKSKETADKFAEALPYHTDVTLPE